MIPLRSQNHVIVVTEVQSLARPIVKVIGDGNRSTDVAEAFLGLSHAKVLIERLGALNRGLVNPLTAADVVGCAVTLKTAVVLAAATRGWIVRAVTFDNVIFYSGLICAAVPLRGVTAGWIQGERRVPAVFPERKVKAIMGARII